MTEKEIDLSIVVPAHNEESRLGTMLDQYACFFFEECTTLSCEMIVMVNGSTDRTAEIARQYAEKFPAIKVLVDEDSIGKGGAVLAGVRSSRGQQIGFVDADGATAPAEFFRLYQQTVGHDGIIASRWAKGAVLGTSQKAMRLVSSRLFNGLTRVLLGLKYRDTQCGAKIFKREAWTAILPDVGITRFAFDVDLLFQLKRHNYVIIEEPTAWSDVAGSTVDVVKTSIEMFFAIIRMRLIYSRFSFVVPIYEKFLSRLVNTLLGDHLFRHMSLLFVASLVGMVCNMGFQMIVGRMLPAAEFALLATFLTLFAVFGRPMGAFAMAISHYVSLLNREGNVAAMSRLLQKWIVRMAVGSSALMAIMLIFSRAIADYFYLERVAPVVVSAIAIPLISVGSILSGALQGLERFRVSSVSSVIGSMVRILATGACLIFFYKACGWALLGHVISMGSSVLIGGFALKSFLLKRADKKIAVPTIRHYVWKSALILLCLGFLLMGDVSLVTRFFPHNTEFAYAATLGRLVAFMAAAVAAALFPKVVSAGQFTAEHRKLYIHSQLYTAGFIVLSLFICLVIPRFMLSILFGVADPTTSLIALTRAMALAMVPATLLNINANVLLAQRRFNALSFLVAGALVYFLGVRSATSVMSVPVWAGLVNLGVLVGTTVAILKFKGGSDDKK